MRPCAFDSPSGTNVSPASLMRALPVSDVIRPVSIAYRFCACVMSACDAPGKFPVVNIDVADSVARTPNVAVGIRVWFRNHTSACTIDPPKVTLCLPRTYVAVSSTTHVEASRDEPFAAPPLVAVLPVLGLVRRDPAPQQALNRSRRYPLVWPTPVPCHIAVAGA